MTVAADPRWTPARIRALRKSLGLTQPAFADALGYDRWRSVADLENDRMEPSGSVCKVLDYIEACGVLPSRESEGEA